MLRAIAVETGLHEIKDCLQQHGYHVFDTEECHHPVRAVVYTGKTVPDYVAAMRPARSTILLNAFGLNGSEVVTYLENKMG